MQACKVIVLVLLSLSLICCGEAQDFLTGVRGGASFQDSGHPFTQVEGFAGMNLPWDWRIYSDFYLRPRVEVSAGWINSQDADGFIGTLGPVVELRKGKFPVTLEGGVSPTVLSRYHFGGMDFGGRFQFTDHVGVNWEVTRQFSVGARFQHMSNGGISEPNPGLNLLMLSARYNF
jgi:hypothetical protein